VERLCSTASTTPASAETFIAWVSITNNNGRDLLPEDVVPEVDANLAIGSPGLQRQPPTLNNLDNTVLRPSSDQCT
jgi:hypothetical protein